MNTEWVVWIARIDRVVIAVIILAKGIWDTYQQIHYKLPQQLVQLVQQAHADGNFRTEWDIAVSSEMWDALCQPLTPEQLQEIRSAKEGVYSRSVDCHLISGNIRGGTLYGVVQASVIVHSRYSKHDLKYPTAQLRIIVTHNGRQYPNGKWEVNSVEQIA